MRALSVGLTLASEGHTEFLDITKMIEDAVRSLEVPTGLALINTLHTTCALFINEYQGALIEDFRALVERLVPERGGYRHDDPRVSDCERGNGHAHLRAALLGRSITVAVTDGQLALGRYQSIIFAELDGPRRRDIRIQVVGA
jgi:secondary thiamine-phosphate synthase enzyme